MLIEVLEQLREVGIQASILKSEEVHGDFRLDAIVSLAMDGVKRRFAVEVRARSPYPGELPGLIERLRRFAKLAHPFLVTSYVSPSLGEKLSEGGWSWADKNGNFDIRAPQFRARQRVSTTPPKPPRPYIPRGPGALAIIRFLINESAPNQPFGPSELAKVAGVSQPRATQVLQRLRDMRLVSGAGGNWSADREALLDAFLQQYRGPGGSEQLFYSLDPPSKVAENLVRWSKSRGANMSISADVGPDLIASWRRPTHVVAYLRDGAPASQLDFVRAKSHEDANVILRVPDDTSVFSIHPVVQGIGGVKITCADITQMIWDLKDLGGSDREEAADNLRQWLLTRH